MPIIHKCKVRWQLVIIRGATLLLTLAKVLVLRELFSMNEGEAAAQADCFLR